MLNKLIILSSIFIVSHYAQAITEKKAQISLFGVFNFANPDLSTVKSKKIDVSTDDNQAYLISLSNNIAENFKPTNILLECAINNQNQINAEYQQYLKDNFILPINESYQIGFRVAKSAKVKTLTCYDERNTQKKADTLMKAIPDKAPKTQVKLNTAIKKVTKRIERIFTATSLKKILIAFNTTKPDNLNKSTHVATNNVGADGWHRNLKMYANIQKVAVPSSRVLVIGGQEHTAILKDLSALDNAIETVDIKTFL